MKYFIVGDMHGSSIKILDEIITALNPEVIANTGDYDSPETLKEFFTLKEKYEKQGKKVIVVPGNHDHAIYNNFEIHITNDTMQPIQELHYAFQKDTLAQKYLESLIHGPIQAAFYLAQEEYRTQYPTVVLHGAYRGNLSSYPKCPTPLKPLWRRLEKKQDHEENFAEMRKMKYRIMIRGHDHEPEFATQTTGYITGKFTTNTRIMTPRLNNDALTIYPDQYTVITPGAFEQGCFAIIETTKKKDYPFVAFYQI